MSGGNFNYVGAHWLPPTATPGEQAVTNRHQILVRSIRGETDSIEARLRLSAGDLTAADSRALAFLEEYSASNFSVSVRPGAHCVSQIRDFSDKRTLVR